MISTHAKTAKAIREELKKSHIKAAVRSKSYTGGSAVYISTEDLSPTDLKVAQKISEKYQSGHFDGMDDTYKYSNRSKDLPQVKFVTLSNTYSLGLKQLVVDLIHIHGAIDEGLGVFPKRIEDVEDYKQLEFIGKTLNGSSHLSETFWTPEPLSNVA